MDIQHSGRSGPVTGTVQFGTEPAVELASPVERLLARAVDTGVVIALTAIVGGFLHWSGSPFGMFENPGPHVPPSWPEVGVLVAVWSLYETFGRHLGLSGSTPGKDLLRIQVVRALDGGLLGWRQAVSRWSVLAGGLLAVAIAKDRSSPWYVYGAIAATALAILVTEYRQGLHDQAAGSVVIRVQKWTWAGVWTRVRHGARRVRESWLRAQQRFATVDAESPRAQRFRAAIRLACRPRTDRCRCRRIGRCRP
ncbi:RDD family protein [Candidatus Poriferisodalis sp.]|uniref:RDD family protein n=1 Tax=Candidatus Poriferisodalis sp. TaxID=3101277 RepID=UPI003B014B25